MTDDLHDDGRSPWHSGERILQRRVGAEERLERVGRHALRDHLIDQHRRFYPQLPFVVLGAVDRRGDVWATLRAGRAGFLSSPDPFHLVVDLARDPADPAEDGLDDGEAVAVLGIELHTRRRNRLNGTVRSRGGAGFTLVVGQAFGNCPKYINLRDFSFVRNPISRAGSAVIAGKELDALARALIAAADTFFVASYVDRGPGFRQVDVSHRGGEAGFVRVGDDGVLTIPDFAGNQFFNTLGNFLINPRTGLVFVDFRTGDVLQLTGDTEVVLDPAETAGVQGAERLWRFRPRAVSFRSDALPLRWSPRAEPLSAPTKKDLT